MTRHDTTRHDATRHDTTRRVPHAHAADIFCGRRPLYKVRRQRCGKMQQFRAAHPRMPIIYSGQSVPTRCPHGAHYGAHCKNTQFLHFSRFRECESLESLNQRSQKSPLFAVGTVVGTVWAPCGHRVGTVGQCCLWHMRTVTGAELTCCRFCRLPRCCPPWRREGASSGASCRRRLQSPWRSAGPKP